MNNRWINLETINPEGKINLICFPYSGTGASFYASWGKKAPKELNILPVSYPMREKRMKVKNFLTVCRLFYMVTAQAVLLHMNMQRQFRRSMEKHRLYLYLQALRHRISIM